MKSISVYCDTEKIKQLDQFVKFPVSRSQVFDIMIEYILRNPQFLQSLIEHELEKIQTKIATSENTI